MSSSSAENNEWEDHASATNDVWKHFLRSKSKVGGGRFRCKCKYCDEIMEGKPQRMRKHLLVVCTGIPFDAKAALLALQNSTTAENVAVDEDGQSVSTRASMLSSKLVHHQKASWLITLQKNYQTRK